MEDGPEAMVDPGDALWVRPDGDLESSFRSCLSDNRTAVKNSVPALLPFACGAGSAKKEAARTRAPSSGAVSTSTADLGVLARWTRASPGT